MKRRNLTRNLFIDTVVTPRRRWRHLLSSPLIAVLADGIDGPVRFSDPALLVWSLRSLRELVRERGRPPIEFLRWMKGCAKVRLAGEPRDRPIFATVYYVSIALARVRLGTLITTLTAEQLSVGLSWASRHPWLDRGTKNLLDRAYTRFR